MNTNFPFNANFSGTVSAPLFVSNQVLIAPVAAGTASTLTVGSFSATYLSVASSITSASLFASTLSVGTILNFSAGGSIGTNLALSGTLTAASLSGLFGSLSQAYTATLSVGTILNFFQGQTVSSSGTVSGSFLPGTATCPVGFSVSGTLTSAAINVGSLSGTYGSLTQAYTSTLSVGTILNFSAGGANGTNLALTGTLTAATAAIVGPLTVGTVQQTQTTTTALGEWVQLQSTTAMPIAIVHYLRQQPDHVVLEPVW